MTSKNDISRAIRNLGGPGSRVVLRHTSKGAKISDFLNVLVRGDETMIRTNGYIDDNETGRMVAGQLPALTGVENILLDGWGFEPTGKDTARVTVMYTPLSEFYGCDGVYQKDHSTKPIEKSFDVRVEKTKRQTTYFVKRKK
jgi:hypothetical protein